MRPLVTVVDYGRGNLFSIDRALSHVGAEARFCSSPAELLAAERVILPGVGAFGDGMQGLKDRGLVAPLVEYAKSGRPLMGICLGMQLLLSESEEFGRHEGLNLVPGKVVRFKDEAGLKIPHVGWNALTPGSAWSASALAESKPGADMYFVHSYVAAPESADHVLARTRYGAGEFCSALKSGAVEGYQFHPEKSGEEGLCLLRTWLKRTS